MKVTRYVISAIQNDTDINKKFMATLDHFCKLKKAEMILIPTKYLGKLEKATWDERYTNRICDTERNIGKSVKILGDLELLSSLENPCAGFDAVSKGKTIFVGHPQYYLKSLPRNTSEQPRFLIATGAVTVPNVNSNSKAGKKALQNHTLVAQYLSIVDEGTPKEELHIRALCFDGVGFFDVDGYYADKTFKPGVTLEALVPGDDHVIEIDPSVMGNVYTNKNSMVNILKPKIIVHHDTLDCTAITHHAKGLVVKQNAMEKNGTNDLEKELTVTCEFVLNTTPAKTKALIVASNHNEHLDRWLQDPDSNLDRKNAKLYHWFMYNRMLDENKGKTAFQMYMNHFYPKSLQNVEFLNRDVPRLIKGIEVHNHGDLSANGGKNGKTFFPKYDHKVIHGHIHSPSVDKTSYCVGTSSKYKLSYTSGNTSWNHTVCLIYANGERQLVHILNNKWFV